MKQTLEELREQRDAADEKVRQAEAEAAAARAHEELDSKITAACADETAFAQIAEKLRGQRDAIMVAKAALNKALSEYQATLTSDVYELAGRYQASSVTLIPRGAWPGPRSAVGGTSILDVSGFGVNPDSDFASGLQTVGAKITAARARLEAQLAAADGGAGA